MPLTCFHDKSGMIKKVKDPKVDLIQFSLSVGIEPVKMLQWCPYILWNGAVFL